MTREVMKDRTKDYANRIERVCSALLNNWIAQTLGRQLLRAGTSVGANYRAACRSKSAPDFISKMGTVEEEADESGYWMELLTDSGKVKLAKVSALLQEANELTAIAVASINTARKSARRR